MTNYYFTKNPDVIHDEKEWTFKLLNNEFKFTTDNGVFSKKTVDFGSRVLLDAVEQQEIIPGNILDVGCGYGPIGLAIAKSQPERKIDMTDVNELALELAKKNAVINKITNIEVFESAAYSHVTKTDYAAILTNPPIRAGKEVVHEILSGAFDHLKVGGQLFAVLQKKQGASSAQKRMTEVFGNCDIILKDKGYYILMSVK